MRTKLWLDILRGNDHSKDLDVDGRKILKLFIGKYVSMCALDSYGSG
jgi:hypothetical protein